MTVWVAVFIADSREMYHIPHAMMSRAMTMKSQYRVDQCLYMPLAKFGGHQRCLWVLGAIFWYTISVLVTEISGELIFDNQQFRVDKWWCIAAVSCHIVPI